MALFYFLQNPQKPLKIRLISSMFENIRRKHMKTATLIINKEAFEVCLLSIYPPNTSIVDNKHTFLYMFGNINTSLLF
jgi:hypothetical protein